MTGNSWREEERRKTFSPYYPYLGEEVDPEPPRFTVISQNGRCRPYERKPESHGIWYKIRTLIQRIFHRPT
jgi:hypothetical protein